MSAQFSEGFSKLILSPKRSPSVLLLNARSVLNKMDELRGLICNLNPGCVAVTESWLSDDVYDGPFLVGDYVLYRGDRVGRIGGGVCMWIHESFISEQLCISQLDMVEAVSVRISEMNIIVWCMYIPPNLSASCHRDIVNFMTTHIDSFCDKYSDVNFIICGDFNDFDTNLFNILYNCVNKVSLPTRGQAFLDQVWISEDIADLYPNDASVGPPLGSSDHNCVFLTSSSPSCKSLNAERVYTVFDYRLTHLSNFTRHLETSSFDSVYEASDVNEKCLAFYRVFFDALSLIPQRKIVFRSTDKPWLTPVVKLLIEDRWTAYRCKDWPRYHFSKEKVKAEIMKAKRKWSERLIKKRKNVWDIVNDISGKRQVNQCFQSDHKFLCDLSLRFANSFNSEADQDLIALPNEMWNLKISQEIVHRLLMSLRHKQSSGPDDIPSRLLVATADFIAEPLTHIFQCSVDTMVFPEMWKNAYVSPVQKCSKPTLSDFRPISLTPIISKVFERVVLDKMKDSFVHHSGCDQHAFRPHGSATSALIDLLHSITLFMEHHENQVVRVTCLDLSKAFDKVQHNRLVNLLHNKGFNGGFLKWLKSYLTSRIQHIRINGQVGPPCDVLSGVPQGSVLGPYLFSLFMSSLSIDSPNVRLIKFADDLSLVQSINRISDVPNSLTDVEDWASSSKNS